MCVLKILFIYLFFMKVRESRKMTTKNETLFLNSEFFPHGKNTAVSRNRIRTLPSHYPSRIVTISTL